MQSSNLPPPTELIVQPEEDDAGDAWFAVSWDAVPQAVSYNLYYATDPSVNADNYLFLPEGDAVFDITNNYVAVSNLLSGVTYYFTATAGFPLGESAGSFPGSGVFGEYAEVSGTVFAMIGQGTNSLLEEVPKVTITLSNLDQAELSATAISDANGAYLFPAAAGGDVLIRPGTLPDLIGGSLPGLLEITNSDISRGPGP